MKPSHVLMTYSEFVRLTGKRRNLVDLVCRRSNWIHREPKLHAARSICLEVSAWHKRRLRVAQSWRR